MVTGTQVMYFFVMRISIYEAIHGDIYKDVLFCFYDFVFKIKFKALNIEW